MSGYNHNIFSGLIEIHFLRFYWNIFWVLQPAIYVASLAAVEALRSEINGQEIIDSVDVACGLSLGEYTALAFAGVFRWKQQYSALKKF